MTNLRPGQRVFVCEDSRGTPIGMSGTVVRENTVSSKFYWIKLDVEHKSCPYPITWPCQIAARLSSCLELP
jgi:hypothetical protein